MAIHDIAVISLPVSDPQRAKDFYVRTLGFELLRDDSSIPGIRWILVRPAGATVAISLVTWFDTMPAGSARGLVIRTADLSREHRELSARGVTFAQMPKEQPWGFEAVFADADGNQIVLQQSR